MAKRISENEILIPALYIIRKYGSASTAVIRQELVKMFKPKGEDAAILKGRKDSKFTQIIRNLTGSHSSTNNFGKYTIKSIYGFSLSDEGILFLNDHISQCEYIYDNDFEYDENIEIARKIHHCTTSKKKLITYNEDNTIVEGKSIESINKAKTRSALLREKAVEHYKDEDGHIKCAVCGFDFLDCYGEIGRLFIHIHHEHPICEYDDEGTIQNIMDAVKNVKPVCANCHCMLHRKKAAVLNIEELKEIIRNNDRTNP